MSSDLQPAIRGVTMDLAPGDACIASGCCPSCPPCASPHVCLPFRKNAPSPGSSSRIHRDTPRFVPPRPPAFASHHAFSPRVLTTRSHLALLLRAWRAPAASHTHGLPRARLLCWLAAGTHGPRAACTARRGLVLNKQANPPVRMRRMYRAVCVAIARF
jgi:hypothetical protein